MRVSKTKEARQMKMKQIPPQKPDGRLLTSVNDPEWGMLTAMGIFDETNITEVMKKCMLLIYPLYPEDDTSDWLIQKANEYIAVQNFEIAVDLLQRLTLARVDSERTDRQEEEILELTLKIIHLTEEEYGFRENFKEALDILFGIIERHPLLYGCGGSISVLLKRLFLSYQEGVEYDVLTKIVILAGSANDEYLLPCVKDFYQRTIEGFRDIGITPFFATHNNEWYRLLAICSHMIITLEEDARQ